MKYAKVRTTGRVSKKDLGGFVSGAVGGASSGAAFGAPGAIIGGVLGGVFGSSTADKQAEADRKARQDEQTQRLAMEKQQKEDYSRAVLSTYPTQGVAGVQYYRKGGKLHQPLNRHIVRHGNQPNMGVSVSNVMSNNNGGVVSYSGGGFMGINPAHKGYCTPMTKSTCTGHRKALAETLKKHHGFRANGGTLPKITQYPDGGKLVPLANNAFLAKGDTHEQDTNRDGKTGITLQGRGGQDVAEVENDEVLVGDKVYSKRLGYAPIAEQLAKEKGKYEPKINSSNTIERNTAKRMVARLGGRLDGLFNHQEASKGNSGSYKMANGGTALEDIGNVTGAVVPFIDNLVNANITRSTPAVPRPIFNKAIPLLTNYNAAPELNNVDTGVAANAENIRSNTSNSATANANSGVVYGEGIREKNNILGRKAQIETGLRNQNVMNQQGVINSNVAQENQYNNATMQRQYTVQDRASKNVANAVGDLQQGIVDRNLKNLDNQKIVLSTKAMSLDNDAAAYQSFDQILPAYKQQGREDELKDMLSKTQSGRSLWNKHFPNKAFNY